MTDVLRILVLEDEPMILMDLAFALEDEGAVAVEAANVGDAIAFIKNSPPDAAILDVNLGRSSTCEPVARELEALGIPFLLHSGDLNRQGELVTSFDAQVVAKPAPSRLVAKQVISLVSNGS